MHIPPPPPARWSGQAKIAFFPEGRQLGAKHCLDCKIIYRDNFRVFSGIFWHFWHFLGGPPRNRQKSSKIGFFDRFWTPPGNREKCHVSKLCVFSRIKIGFTVTQFLGPPFFDVFRGFHGGYPGGRGVKRPKTAKNGRKSGFFSVFRGFSGF